MKCSRIVVRRFGPPDVLQVEERWLPPLPSYLVRVRTLFAGVSWADLMMRCGQYPSQPKPPFTPGYDMVGEIVDVGSTVDRKMIGRRVAALTVTGSYSEYVDLPIQEVVEFPLSIAPEAAVSLVLNYVTAWQMLHRVAQVQAGQAIVVHSAAGGVGTALLQLAGLAGVLVFGVTSESKLPLVESLGAVGIDRQSENFVQRVHEDMLACGVHAVFDPIGGKSWMRSWRALNRGGKLVAFGSLASLQSDGSGWSGKMTDVSAFLRLLFRPGKHFVFYSITEMKARYPEWFREDLSLLLKLLQQGRIVPYLTQSIPWKQAAEAHRLLESGEVKGKLVLGF
jgi:NADPH:quinone reductase-like Zn-dependent oxidoreductase